MNKLSELKAAALAATPGPWKRTVTRFNGITNSTHSMASFSSEGVLANANEKRDAIFIAAANPAVVLDLLAELEAKTKHIAELELDELAMRASSRAVHEAQENHINQQQDRIDSLEKTNAGLGRGLAAAEQKLATPVRLPTTSGRLGVAYTRVIPEVIEAIRAAGFTVEGDEQ